MSRGSASPSSLRSPDQLPTFRRGLLGLSAALSLWEGVVVVRGVDVRVLAPLLFALVTLLPGWSALAAGGAVLGVLLALLGVLTPDEVPHAFLVLGGAVGLGAGARHFLLPIEWELASRKVLGALLDLGQDTRPEEALREVLSLVRELSGAHAVVALRQLDELAAETLVALPDSVLPESLTTPRLFAEALAENRCHYHSDYTRAPGASRFLLAQGARSLAVLPLRWNVQGEASASQGAILLIWNRRVRLHAPLRRFTELLLGELRTLLRLTDSSQRFERLQARYGAILETVPEGVVFVEASGEQGWVNHVAAGLLGLPPGPAEPVSIAQAMAGLRARASNQEEIAERGARLFSNPQADIRDWVWTFQEPRERVLSLSSTPTRMRDLQGRLWLFNDITEAWGAQRARRKAELALREEQERTERLLLNILPQPIARRLKKSSRTIADGFSDATILFADIVDFTQLATEVSPKELVYLLNEIFSAFDELTEKHGLEKIKTIGDAYMVAGGLPSPDPEHVEAIAEMALDMMRFVRGFSPVRGTALRLRTGINTGPVVAGVIGTKKFNYDLWGDTVNLASRMESHGLPGHIHVTQATYERLRDKYVFTPRGTIPIKGKGELSTWLLEGRRN